MTAKRVRIGVDMHVFDGKFQGSRSHLLGVYGELTRMCPEFDFVFLLEQTDQLRAIGGFAEPNVERVFMPHASSLKRLFWQLPRLRRRLRLDLIHTQYVIPLWPAKSNAVTIHDVLFEPYPEFFGRFFVFRSRLMMRWSARMADMVLTVSNYSRDEISRRYGCLADQIGVTHNAVDRTVFFPGSEGQGLVEARGLVSGEYLLTVGRIEPRKNHAVLLRAYRQLPGTPPPLVIVGQRDFGFGEFETEMALMPLDRRVIILSNVGDNELPALYRHAMIFVYPSFAEGFGMPPLEAMASGTPVVTTDSTAIPEVVGDAGVLVKPNDEKELVRRLAELICDKQERRKLACEGVKRSQDFTWSASAMVLASSFRSYFEISA